LVEDAREQGASVLLDGPGVKLIAQATPAMLAMRTEIFAPILSLMRTADLGEALAADAVCPYALTASVFGPEVDARALASRLRVGNVLINDIVVLTADPRIAFGGRGRSGFGVTRGAEGLLGMTTPRTIQTQRKPSARSYQATGEGHVEFFSALALALYAKSWKSRWDGLRRLVRAARLLG
jgi:aldehyde dehydrogenase (NAD+)